MSPRFPMARNRSSDWNKALSVASSVTSTNSDIVMNATDSSKLRADCSKFSQLPSILANVFTKVFLRPTRRPASVGLMAVSLLTRAITAAADCRQAALELRKIPSTSVTRRRNFSDKDSASSTASSVALPRADISLYVLSGA